MPPLGWKKWRDGEGSAQKKKTKVTNDVAGDSSSGRSGKRQKITVFETSRRVLRSASKDTSGIYEDIDEAQESIIVRENEGTGRRSGKASVGHAGRERQPPSGGLSGRGQKDAAERIKQLVQDKNKKLKTMHFESENKRLGQLAMLERKILHGFRLSQATLHHDTSSRAEKNTSPAPLSHSISSCSHPLHGIFSGYFEQADLLLQGYDELVNMQEAQAFYEDDSREKRAIDGLDDEPDVDLDKAFRLLDVGKDVTLNKVLKTLGGESDTPTSTSQSKKTAYQPNIFTSAYDLGKRVHHESPAKEPELTPKTAEDAQLWSSIITSLHAAEGEKSEFTLLSDEVSWLDTATGIFGTLSQALETLADEEIESLMAVTGTSHM